MSTRRHQPAAPAKRGLTALEALAELAKIDGALDALCATAPRAIEILGGREALQSTCEMTCIGPVPRLTSEEWETFAVEHANRQRGPLYHQEEVPTLSFR